jgi:glycosyltransferase involved in cell wall biosynthesis
VRGIWEITQASANGAYAQTLRYKLSRALENQAVREADHVVVISEQLRRFVIEQGARPDAVSVLPNGVDTAHMHALPPDPELKTELGIAAGAVVIGYAGSVLRYEGLDLVIEAMARLRSRSVGAFHFLLVGDGRELPALKALAASHNLDHLCTFTGRVSRERVEALYRVIDIAPLPRRSLPVTELVPPLKPFEAMAAGKAVVVSNTAAIAETVIDGQTGLVVEKNSIPALTNALQRLIEDTEMRERLSRQGRDWVLENRTAERLVRDVQEIYAKLPYVNLH